MRVCIMYLVYIQNDDDPGPGQIAFSVLSFRMYMVLVGSSSTV